MNSRVRKLRSPDVTLTARLLARAFSDNTAYGFMHPRVATRERDLFAFFHRNLAWHRPLDLTWVITDGDDRPLGTATVEPPGGVRGTRLQLLRHWVLPTLIHQGRAVLGRILEADAAFARLKRSTAEADTYWHVHAVAVEPGVQRKGLGTSLLRYVLAELDRLVLASPAPVILLTQRESNVKLYQRFGFEERGCFTIGAGTPAAFRSWCMRRSQTA